MRGQDIPVCQELQVPPTTEAMQTEIDVASRARREAQQQALAQGVVLAWDYYAKDLEAREWAEFLGDQPEYDRE